MRQALIIAWYTAVRQLRDTQSLLLQVALPILLIVLLGGALSDGLGIPGSPGTAEQTAERAPRLVEPEVPVITRLATHNGLPLRATDYYAVTITVMIVLFGALYVSDSMHELRVVTALRQIAGRSRASAITGVVLASTLTVWLQALLLAVVTRVGLNAAWGVRPLWLAMALLVVALFACTAGGIAALTVRSQSRTTLLLQVLIFGSTVAAGGFIPYTASAGALRLLRRATPSHAAHRALFGLIHAAGADGAANPLPGVVTHALGRLLLATLVCAIVLAVRCRRSDAP